MLTIQFKITGDHTFISHSAMKLPSKTLALRVFPPEKRLHFLGPAKSCKAACAGGGSSRGSRRPFAALACGQRGQWSTDRCSETRPGLCPVCLQWSRIEMFLATCSKRKHSYPKNTSEIRLFSTCFSQWTNVLLASSTLVKTTRVCKLVFSFPICDLLMNMKYVE